MRSNLHKVLPMAALVGLAAGPAMAQASYFNHSSRTVHLHFYEVEQPLVAWTRSLGAGGAGQPYLVESPGSVAIAPHSELLLAATSPDAYEGQWDPNHHGFLFQFVLLDADGRHITMTTHFDHVPAKHLGKVQKTRFWNSPGHPLLDPQCRTFTAQTDDEHPNHFHIYDRDAKDAQAGAGDAKDGGQAGVPDGGETTAGYVGSAGAAAAAQKAAADPDSKAGSDSAGSAGKALAGRAWAQNTGVFKNHLDEPCVFTVKAEHSDVQVGVSGQADTTVSRTRIKDFSVPPKGQLWFKPVYDAETLEETDDAGAGKAVVGCIINPGSHAKQAGIFVGWFAYLGKNLRADYGGVRDTDQNSGFMPVEGIIPMSCNDDFTLLWSPDAPGILGLTKAQGR